jgi:hypothetical protein
MVALAALAVGSEARAQANVHSGDVLRPGDNMIYAEAGWPDLAIGFQHGMTDKVDLGFRFSFDYGYDYTTGTSLGMGMRVPIRITPVRRPKFSFQIHIDPGIKFDNFGNGGRLCGLYTGCRYYDSGLLFGLWIPFGLEFGIHVTPEATINFGMEMPIYINLTNGTYGNIPLLFGPGFEYHIDDHITLGVNMRFGPSIFTVSDSYGNSYSNAVFGLIGQAFFGYRL